MGKYFKCVERMIQLDGYVGSTCGLDEGVPIVAIEFESLEAAERWQESVAILIETDSL